MSELKTLYRQDPMFNSYIWGYFSKSQRALPIQSLNVSTENEKVTFEIINFNEISMPSFFTKWVTILKIKNFIWVLLPLFLVLVKNVNEESEFDPWLALLSAMGAIFIHAAMNLTNEIQDHIRGLDRIYQKAGSRSLQKGWVTAHQLKIVSYIFSFIGLGFGVPSIVIFPEILWIVLPLVILGGLGLTSYKMGLQYRAWSEIVVFLMLGPLLTVGYQLSFGVKFDLEVVFLGVMTGWLAVFNLHIKNLELLIAHSMANFNNTVTRLGFEKSKKLIVYWWALFVMLFVVYHGFYGVEIEMWISAFYLIVMTIFLFNVVNKMKSPIGSSLQNTIFVSEKITILVVGFWIVENIIHYCTLEF